jgi:hypothetical protein
MHPALQALTKASKGLLFPSETEAELSPFLWAAGETPTPERLRQLADADAESAVETTTLPELLQTVPSEDRARFQALQATLQANLAGIQVFRVGDEAEKAVWIVGRTADGSWAGLKTTVVES